MFSEIPNFIEKELRAQSEAREDQKEVLSQWEGSEVPRNAPSPGVDQICNGMD